MFSPRFLSLISAKIFFILNYENRERRIVRPIEKITFHNVILRPGKGRNEFKYSISFGIAVVAAVINAKGKHSAGLKDIKGFFYGGDACFRTGKNIVASTGKPAKIKNNAVCAVRLCEFIDIAVAYADNLAHFRKTVLFKIFLGGIHRILLDIHGEQMSFFSGKFTKIYGIMSVAGSGVNAKITWLYMHFKNFVYYTEGAVFAEHKNLQKGRNSYIILIQQSFYVKKINECSKTARYICV